jgi:AcrR family transcriptional regulator
VATQPRWRRRSEARPAEIVAAALAVFADKGFAAARLEDIAAQAGISKGALYLYFETKTDLFRAVVRDAVAPNLAGLSAAAEGLPGPFEDLVRMLFGRLSAAIRTARLGAVAKMVVGESRNFPDLALVWHDAVVAPALGAVSLMIERAQARGEVRAGNPRLFAVGLAAPVLVSALWAEVFEPVGARPLDIDALLQQHADTVLRGMRPEAAQTRSKEGAGHG